MKFLSVANPLIPRAPPEIFIVAGTRTPSGFTTSNTRTNPKSNQLIPYLVRNLELFFMYFKLPWVAVAQSANPST